MITSFYSIALPFLFSLCACEYFKHQHRDMLSNAWINEGTNQQMHRPDSVQDNIGSSCAGTGR